LAGVAVFAGCGGDDEGEPASRMALAEQLVIEFDRSTTTHCECFVLIGAYASVDECVRLLGSGPDWAECGVKVLEDADGALDVEDPQCIIDDAAARADCLEAAKCDPSAVAACQEMREECAILPADLVNALLEACPDTGLLSRLDE
jgi:hypothetical protein